MDSRIRSTQIELRIAQISARIVSKAWRPTAGNVYVIKAPKLIVRISRNAFQWRTWKPSQVSVDFRSNLESYKPGCHSKYIVTYSNPGIAIIVLSKRCVSTKMLHASADILESYVEICSELFIVIIGFACQNTIWIFAVYVRPRDSSIRFINSARQIAVYVEGYILWEAMAKVECMGIPWQNFFLFS
jgi:hypothetical protein